MLKPVVLECPVDIDSIFLAVSLTAAVLPFL